MTIYMNTAARPTRELPMSDAERKARVELAACYRIFDMLGWTEMIFNHITLRVPGPDHHFLINPFGLHYREVTASNLVLIDLEGDLVPQGRAVARQLLWRDAARQRRVPRLRRGLGRVRREGAPGARYRRQAVRHPAQPRAPRLGPERGRGVSAALDAPACLRRPDHGERR